MFTGIIKELGVLHRLSKAGDIYKLAIESKDIFEGLNIGDSVSVNGVCLTVAEKKKNILSFDIVEETIRKTALKALKDKELVNLEDPLRVGDSFGGHFVLGHIDCAGKITDIKRANGVSIELEIPKEFANLIVEKGSIAIDGVSLTIGEIRENAFKVYLIPHTLEATTLGKKRRGDELNIEFDLIGKYIVRSKRLGKKKRITEEFLKAKGF